MERANLYVPGCPTLMILDRVANRWSVLVLSLVLQQPQRFNQLRRALDGISQKVLSQTLKLLERDGLVSRRVAQTAPVTVEYSITLLGSTLVDTVNAVRIWSDANYANVLEAQERFDRQQRWPLETGPARMNATA